MLFDKLPKRLTLTIMLIKALDLKNGMKLIQDIMYLWREFFIKVNIEPIIKEYVVSFYYKDNQLIQFRTNDLKEVLEVSKKIKESRVD
jgi:hypothetical protein